MEHGENFSGDDDDDDEDNHYLSLDEIIIELETFYGKKEAQNVLFKELRSLKIIKNEKVKDFNIHYRSLYLKFADAFDNICTTTTIVNNLNYKSKSKEPKEVI